MIPNRLYAVKQKKQHIIQYRMISKWSSKKKCSTSTCLTTKAMFWLSICCPFTTPSFCAATQKSVHSSPRWWFSWNAGPSSARSPRPLRVTSLPIAAGFTRFTFFFFFFCFHGSYAGQKQKTCELLLASKQLVIPKAGIPNLRSDLGVTAASSFWDGRDKRISMGTFHCYSFTKSCSVELKQL